MVYTWRGPSDVTAAPTGGVLRQAASGVSNVTTLSASSASWAHARNVRHLQFVLTVRTWSKLVIGSATGIVRTAKIHAGFVTHLQPTFTNLHPSPRLPQMLQHHRNLHPRRVLMMPLPQRPLPGDARIQHHRGGHPQAPRQHPRRTHLDASSQQVAYLLRRCMDVCCGECRANVI